MDGTDKSLVAVNSAPQTEPCFTYKSSRIFKPIPPSSIDLPFFKKLFDALKISAEESANCDIARFRQRPGQSPEDFEGLKNYARGLYKVTIHIYGFRGEYIYTENPDIFDSLGIPDRIDRIVFENSTRYKAFQQKEPVNQLRIPVKMASVSLIPATDLGQSVTPQHVVACSFGAKRRWTLDSGLF